MCRMAGVDSVGVESAMRVCGPTSWGGNDQATFERVAGWISHGAGDHVLDPNGGESPIFCASV